MPRPDEESIELIDETGEPVAGEGEGEGNPVKKPTLDEATSKHLMQMGEQRAMARMLTDPDIARLMKLKQDKKKIQIIEEDSSVQRDTGNQTQDADPDWEELDNRGVAEHTVKRVEKLLDSKLEAVMQKMLQPLQEQAAQFSQFAMTQQNREVKGEIDAARKEFADFDKFLPKMKELSDENPKLGVRQLYVLAKMASGTSIKTNRSLESERPTQGIGRPGTATRVKNLAPGRVGLSQLLDAATKNIDLNDDEFKE